MENTVGLAHNLENVPRTDDVRLKEIIPFNKMLLKEAVRKGLCQAGFVYPTVIQATAIPMGKSGIDLLVQSKSGTGKTLIFASVILNAYKKEVMEPQSLIVAPTREIAVQIQENLNKIGKYCDNFNAVCVIGGMDVTDDRKRLQGAKAIVGTPGRILHLIGNSILNTSHIRILVLDEADKMMSNTFRNDILKIRNTLPNRKQIIACSATFENKLDEELAKIMKSPLLVSTEERATVLLGIKQFVYKLPEQKTNILEMQLKLDAIKHIFGRVSFKQCIIFLGSQSRAESYCNYLEKDGWPCELISGAQDQPKRLEQFRKFREFKTRVLITTDLMSRGIDSEHVNMVINLELPTDSVTYLHRIGRAGRFGSHGVAISFVSSQKDETLIHKLLTEVGTGMQALNFPNQKSEKNERDVWNFDSFDDDLKYFGAYLSLPKLTAPLASQESITLTPSLSENKENLKMTPTSLLQQSSINTNTFLIASSESALKVPKLTNLTQSSELCPKNELVLNINNESDNLTTPCESLYDLSQQLITSNTIDDASSIAADSLLSSQHDDSRYQSVLMQKSSIPTLVEFLVDNESLHDTQIKPKQDFFDTYTEEVLNGDNELTEHEVTADGPILTSSKLAQLKSMLIDKPYQKSPAKNIDLYSDFAEFNEDDVSTTASNDMAKQTFILSVATPPIRPDLEEFNNNSSDLYPATDETTITSKSIEAFKNTKHFPSPAHNETQKFPGHIDGLTDANKHKQPQQNQMLSISVAAQIEIPPQPLSPNSTSPKTNVSQYQEEVSPSATENSNSNITSDRESEDLSESSTEGGAVGGNSSGFDEKTSTSGSSGIVTSEHDLEYLQRYMEDYITSSEDEEYDNYTTFESSGSSSEDYEQDIDDEDIDDEIFDDEAQGKEECAEKSTSSQCNEVLSNHQVGKQNSPTKSNTNTCEGSNYLSCQTSSSKWLELYWYQIGIIQDYVKFSTSTRKG